VVLRNVNECCCTGRASVVVVRPGAWRERTDAYRERVVTYYRPPRKNGYERVDICHTDGIDADATQSFSDTMAEAVRIYAKAELLRTRAAECVKVATTIASRGGVDPDELRSASATLKVLGVPGRRALGLMIDIAPVGRNVWTRKRGSNGRLPVCPAFVYLLRGETGAVIYIGVSENIGSRLSSHGSKPWTHADLIGCQSLPEALALEGDLIFQHQPPLNKADTRRRRFVVVD
jgi:hypothetical protein